MSADGHSAFYFFLLPVGIGSSLQPDKQQCHWTKLRAYGMPSAPIFWLEDSEHFPLSDFQH